MKMIFLQTEDHRQGMSAQENQQKVLSWIANQSGILIDYQWEIQHHRQMHEAYEKSL